jgi:hypothetical protein
MLSKYIINVNYNVYLLVDFNITPKIYKDENCAINHVSDDFNFC